MATPIQSPAAAPSRVPQRRLLWPNGLARWLERAEVLARGGESLRIKAEQALSEGRSWEAHSAAKRLLELVPGSKVGLLLLADAAQSLGLTEDALAALEQLSRALPFRADVWLRRAHLEAALAQDPRVSLERADAAGWPSDATDSARMWLCDLDLWLGDVQRAERWLRRCGSDSRDEPAWRWRQIEVLLDLGEQAAALELASKLAQPEILDARGWLTQGRIWAAQGDPSAAWALERALLLEAPRSGPVVAEYLVRSQDAVCLSRIREVVEALGYADHPGWQAALAQAEGRLDAALAALERGAREAPDVAWLQRLALVAEQARSWDGLQLAREGLAAAGAQLPAPLEALIASRDLAPAQQLERLLANPLPGNWASQRIDDAAGELFAPSWSALLGWLGSLALRAGDLALRGELEAISVDLERPLRVAIVGEFNAGKSSFINAWLGSVVAPVGVIPTTAKAHRLAWAPDPYVRVEYASGQERVLPHSELSVELAAEPDVTRVVIYSPLDTLRHLELIDTPGFNSTENDHTAAVEAALADAHVALWLMDAGQPFKASERLCLEQLQRSGVPLVVLVNKRDRLSPVQVEQARAHVVRGLNASGIRLLQPLLFISAREHLAARSGADAAASPRDPQVDGWEGVEHLIEQLRVDARQLKDVALLRRLQRVLKQSPGAAPAPERTEVRPLADALEDLDAEALLRDVAAQLSADLRPLEGAEQEPGASEYAANRTAQRLSAALQRALPELSLGAEAPLLAVAGAWGAGAWRRLHALPAGDQAQELAPLSAELMQVLRGWASAARTQAGNQLSAPELLSWIQGRLAASGYSPQDSITAADPTAHPEAT